MQPGAAGKFGGRGDEAVMEAPPVSPPRDNRHYPEQGFFYFKIVIVSGFFQTSPLYAFNAEMPGKITVAGA